MSSLDLLLEAEDKGLLSDEETKRLNSARERGLLKPTRPDPIILANPAAPVIDLGYDAEPPIDLEDFYNPLSQVNADTTTGAPANIRALAGLKATQEGVLNYLKQQPGVQDVQESEGEIYYLPEGSKQYIKFDENQITGRDFADMTGGAIETIPPTVAGVATGGNPLAVMGAQALGSAVRHGISSQLPGSDDISLGERALDVGIKTGLAGGLQKASNVAFDRIFDKLRPSNLVTQHVNKALSTPTASAGRLAAENTGMDLTPGMLTNSRGILTAENAARQSYYTADKVHAHDLQLGNQALDHIERTMNAIDRNAMGPEAIGNTVRDTIFSTVKKISDARSTQAATDYGLVRQLSGDKKFFEFNNVRSALSEIIEQNKGVPSSDSSSVVSQATRLLKDLSPDPVPGVIGANALPVQRNVNTLLSIDKAMKIRSAYSKASRGTGNLINDISPGLNRQIASRLARAANQDFEAMGQKVGGELGPALRSANANYASYSKSIDYVGNQLLSKMLGVPFDDTAFSGNLFYSTAGETIAARLLKMHPSEHGVLKSVMAEHSPDTVPVIKRFILQNALDKSMDIAPSQGAASLPLSSSKFIKAIPKDKVMKHWFSNQENLDIRITMDALKRWGDRTGANFSGTAPMMQFFQHVNSLSVGSLRGILSFAGQGLGMNRIANAMTTSQGREALKTLTRTSGTTKAMTASAMTLSALWLADYTLYDDAKAMLGQENTQQLSPQLTQQPTLQ